MRMKILNTIEQTSFDKPPLFNSEERKHFFNFSKGLWLIVDRFINPSHKIGFLLACGYFKATKKFFISHTFHQRDINYVTRQLNFDIATINVSQIPQTTVRRHRKYILEHYGFRSFDLNSREYIAKEILEMVCQHLKPKLIFWRSVDLLIQERILIPTYYQLLFSQRLIRERKN